MKHTHACIALGSMLALSTIITLSAARAETVPTTCQTKDQLSAKSDACKVKGMAASIKFNGSCYEFIGCVQPTTAACSASNEDVSKQIQACQGQSRKGTWLWDGACYKFLGCVNAQEALSSTGERSSSVACTKTTKDGCVKIACTDGYLFNSCEPGSLCKSQSTSATASSSSSISPTAIGTTPKGPCSDAEKAAKDAYVKWSANRDNADLKNAYYALSEKMKACQAANFGTTSSAASIPSCTYVRDAQGCYTKTCGKDITHICPNASSASSTPSTVSPCSYTKDGVSDCYYKKCGDSVTRVCPNTTTTR